MFSLKNVLLCFSTVYFITLKSDAYRILVISPCNSKSHNNMLECVGKALALKGHQVDVITHFPLKNPPKNYKTIVNLDGTIPKHVNSWTMDMVKHFRTVDVMNALVNDFGNNFCKFMSEEKIQKLVKNPPKDPPYDLVITEALGANCYFGFGHVFKVPVVMVSGMTEFLWYNEIIGNPISPAFAVNLYTESGRISNFWDRVINTFWVHYNNYRYYKYTEKNQTEEMRKYLSPDIPNIREIEKSVSLMLVNSYQSMFGIKPITPAVVYVAGIQIEQIDIKLSPELQIWMDESTHGVVFFTLGSMVIIEDYPKEVILGLYASFKKIAPIRVLMKIADKKKLPPGLPDNVLTMSWIPQIAVLSHKNTRLFMTHGGLNSVQEALYFGVPMIGFPLFGDQIVNIRLLADKNVVYEMEYDKITEKSLDTALSIVLHGTKYREAAKHESRLFLDRPMNASDTAVFWVEYVIRNGANSLRSPAMDMKWWQVELLDVYGFFLFCIFVVIFVIFCILRILISLTCNFLTSNSRPHRKKD